MSEQIKRIFYCILIFFIGLFIISSFFIRAEFNYYLYGDNPILHKQKLLTFIIYLVVLLTISMVLYYIFSHLNKLSRKLVIPIILLVSFLVQYWIIVDLPVLPTADSKKLLSIASEILDKEDYSSFQKGGYLFKFPFNFSMVVYFKWILATFPGKYFAIKLFNIFFTLATTMFTYLIYREFRVNNKQFKLVDTQSLRKGANSNEYGVLIFAATYIPALFMCNYIYNDVIATTFFTGMLYYMIRFVKDGRMRKLVIASLLLSFGNYLRNIGAIFLIAAIIYLLLNVMKLGIRKITASILILLFLFVIPGWAQNAALQASHKVEASIYQNSAPVHLWLNMGINMMRLGFFDHKKSYNIYEKKAEYDKERSKKLFMEEIRRKLQEASFKDMVGMYYKKILWTWTEGTYQIDRYGLGVDPESVKDKNVSVMGGYDYQTSATELFNRDNRYRGLLLWSLYGINFLIYCFMMIRLFNCMRSKRFDEVLLIIVLLGFIGFYILWEIKSRYIYPVYPILIILSYQGYTNVYDYIKNRNKKQVT